MTRLAPSTILRALRRTLPVLATLAAALAAPGAASAASITTSTTPLRLIADGATMLQLEMTAPSGGDVFTVSVSCGKAWSASNYNQQITQLASGDGNLTFMLTADALSFTDAAGLPITPLPSSCEAQDDVVVDVVGTRDAGQFHIVPVYPTGDVPLHTLDGAVPTGAPALLAVVDGDGSSAARIWSGDPAGVPLQHLNDPGSSVIPDGTIFRALLVPDASGVTGELQSAFGTVTDSFASEDGIVTFSIVAPTIEDRTDVTNTLYVWSENGDARNATVYTVHFLAPGYLGRTLLELPFEDSFGQYSLVSRGSAPLTATSTPAGSTSARLLTSAAQSTHAKKDYAVSRLASEVLVYENSASVMTLNRTVGTIAAWVAPAAGHGDVAIVTDSDATGSGASSIALRLSAGNIASFQFGTETISGAPIPWAAGAYHHLAASWDVDVLTIYLDGAVYAQRTYPVGSYPTPPATLGPAVAVGAGLEGELDQVVTYAVPFTVETIAIMASETPFGSISTSMQAFTTSGFASPEVLGGSLDPQEAVEDHCFDAGEVAGALSQRCTQALPARPQAPVRVVECVDSTDPANPVLTPCDPSVAQDHQADTLYTAAVGAQQFGGATLSSIGVGSDSDVPGIPFAGFAIPSSGSVRFASPVATRFRLPPKKISDLVICNFPAIAGSELNFADAKDYIFEDRPGDTTTHYPDDGTPMANRFRCPTDLVTLEQYRSAYGFKLRDNTNQVLDREWAFKFRTTTDPLLFNGDPYAFEVRTYEPLNDAVRATLTSASPYASTFVTTMVDNQAVAPSPRIVPADVSSVFHLTGGTGLFDTALPGTYTRLAAMTIPDPVDASNPPRTAGYVQMHAVRLQFAGPSTNQSDVASYFDIDPFTITYEVQPAAPSILSDAAMYPPATNPGTFCAQNPTDPTCDAAMQLRLGKLRSTITAPAAGELRAADLPTTLSGTASGGEAVAGVTLTLERLTRGPGNSIVTSWLDWSTGSFVTAQQDLTVPNTSLPLTSTFLWSAPLPASMVLDVDTMYRLSSTAVDAAGTEQVPATSVTFRIVP